LISMSVQRRELASTEGGGGQAGVNQWVANLKRPPLQPRGSGAFASALSLMCWMKPTVETLAVCVVVPTCSHPVYRHLMSAGRSTASRSTAANSTRARRPDHLVLRTQSLATVARFPSSRTRDHAATDLGSVGGLWSWVGFPWIVVPITSC
jgi:hypothetical protein